MDFSKYNQIPAEFATASQIGIAAATLSAMARRGMVEVRDTTPKQYRRVVSPIAGLYQIIEQHKDCEFFTLYRDPTELGMLCYISKGEVVDCWGRKYDLSEVKRIVIGHTIYDYVEEWSQDGVN